jgi:hypothetical protein
VLSGRVYLDGFAVEQVNRFHLPAELRRGDIRLHNVNRPGQRPRFGGVVSFAGFLSACVWDGKGWRKLLLRKKAAMEATHTGVVEMRQRAVECVGALTRLVGWTAVWFAKDSGYEVDYNAFPGKTISTPASAAAPTAEVNAAAVTKAAPASPDSAPAPVPVASKAQMPVQKPGQLSLFEDLPEGGKVPKKRKPATRKRSSSASRRRR